MEFAEKIKKQIAASEELRREHNSSIYFSASEERQESKKSTKKEKLANIVAEKDRKIQELRTQKEELERECELLRGRIFLLMQEKLCFE